MNILGESGLERRATMTLAAATVLVGVSIVTDGSVARAFNGIAGLTWFASSAMFVIEGRRRGATSLQWAGLLALTAGVAFVVKPSDVALTLAGFVPAGFLAGYGMRRDQVFWAKTVPALYLPMHIGTAVLKAVGRSALGLQSSIRTDPPPTAALVPALMLAAAIVGGVLASRVDRRRSAQPSLRSLLPKR